MKNLLLTCCLMLFCGMAIAQVSATEKQALIDLYNATQGDHWNTKWNLKKDVATWHGVTVADDHVTGISLLFNNLEGTLPASIGALTHLRVLELSFNKLSGTLPESLGNLRKLETLAFNGNMLGGTIPSSLGKLGNLKNLHLSSNSFTGTVPTELGKLKKLEVFNVFDNQLTGSLPVAIAKNIKLKELIVAENKFENTETISIILLSTSGTGLDLSVPNVTNTSQPIIATETSNDNE